MLWDGIFVNAVGTYLPRRVSVETISGYSAIDDESADGDFESIAVSDIPAHVMAGLAAKQAVELSNHRDDTLSPIVYTEISMPPEHATPVCHIQRILNQPESLAFGLEAASDGGLTGIEVVARILSSSPSANAGLVSATSRCVDGVDRWAAGQLIGDGAAAAIISKTEGFAQLIASQRTSLPDLEVLHPTRASQPANRVIPRADAGLAPYLSTIARRISDTISITLAEAKVSLKDVSYFCPPTVLRAALKETYLDANGISIDKTCWPELRKNAHVGPCDQLLGIAHLIDTGQLQQGQFIMLLGGGMGWRFTCMLLEVRAPE
jgi:3-oxoacyl-[acyl-carrier-protein] synthase-3